MKFPCRIYTLFIENTSKFYNKYRWKKRNVSLKINIPKGCLLFSYGDGDMAKERFYTMVKLELAKVGHNIKELEELAIYSS